MGEIIGWIALVLIVSGLVAVGVAFTYRVYFKPAPGTSDHDRDVRKAYLLLRRSVTLLNELKVRDSFVPFLSDEEQKQLLDIVSEFDKL